MPAKDHWCNIKDGDIFPECDGQRIGEIARNVVLYNQTGNALSLPQILALTPDQLTNFLKQLKVEDFQKPIVESTIPEITERLKFMGNVGLSYLTLDRETSSLSGGEAQRIRLAGQLGSNSGYEIPVCTSTLFVECQISSLFSKLVIKHRPFPMSNAC